MKIKFFGTRGSIPVSNTQTKKYGGNTTCLYIESKNGHSIIVDAGTGIRELGLYLVQNKKKNIDLLFTHYHWDHIQGFPFFIPIYIKETNLRVFGPSKEIPAKKALSYQMAMPFFPALLDGLPSKISFRAIKKSFDLDGIKVETIINNHPNYTVGLKFTEGKKSFCFLTDNEIHSENYQTPYKNFVNFIRGSNLLIHDAQYTEKIYQSKKGWGHSTYKQVIELIQEAQVKNVIFTHHDPLSSDEFIDRNIKALKTKFPDYTIEAAFDGKTLTVE
ncbi:hypothetical protein BXT86_05585 [candidate division WOR-3 bacterium 4484_100]|uniref:Metallo-beta-lactamase domain-containing protein n=1 Tax=candidate division WOR-3 bacterium 4484_100 TaxID=1936077 RepID=A0A1V4QFU9_UNCW3|nr:MAG: hypothetical protein BXT86_05585 [candidate division WOR-3 bacterium 4484_100]